MRVSIEPGSLLEVRGQRWLLTRVHRFDGCAVLSLEGRDRANAMERTQLIAPFDRLRAVGSSSLSRRRRHTVLTHALASIHDASPIDGLWTAASAQMDLHGYQLEPALAALAGATRLLLADGVGLGKTIQAGLLLSELVHRGWIERGLIVCPPGVRDTWRRELHERFAIAATILDQQSIADRVASFPAGVNPWAADTVVIVSIDFIKRDEVMAAIGAVPVDLLIVDEAHHLTPDSDRGRAIGTLALRSAWCVLISATPHSGDRAAFEYLTNVGAHAERLVVFRRSRRDVGLNHARRTRFLRVHPRDDERALFAAIERYSRVIWAARGRHELAARLVAITVARRASSSAFAVQRTLLRRRELLGRVPEESAQARLPWEEVDDADGDEPAAMLSAPGFENIGEERAALEQLVALASRCRSSSKMTRLIRLLSRIAEPVIVFTEYRDTLNDIVAGLRGSSRVTWIHGGMSPAMRTAAVDAFNGGGFDVLVATDAAGEGLNLHHRCRLVVDFELPWNPLRLEQRIGRVDRLGQTRSVHAIRLYHDATIEQDVFDRLARRREHAERDLDRAVTERDVASAIFTNHSVIGAVVPSLPSCAISTAFAEARRLSRQREYAAHGSTCGRCFATATNGRSRQMWVLRRDTFANASGVIAGNRLVALSVRLCSRPRSLQEWRVAIDRAAASIAPEPPGDAGSGRLLIDRRVDAIRAYLSRQQRRAYQRSLFDGRADAIQSDRDRIASRLDAALRRIQAATATPDPAQTRVEIVAAWPDRRT